MKIVVIEDEKLTAKDLVNTIKAIDPETEITAILYSVEDALLYFQVNKDADLIFSDIELGDGLSFDIFNNTDIKAPIVFCTAYQQYTLEAFQTLGIDYIIKPFSKQSIEKTLIKFKTFKDQFAKPDNKYKNLDSEAYDRLRNKSRSVISYQGDKIIPVSEKDIALFYIENESTFAYTFDKNKVLINQRLDKLEEKFNDFFRVNRQYLINRKAVKDAAQYFNRKLLVNLIISFPEKIIVGKLKTSEFIKWLEEN
ncbi:MAG: LytR/AlgR family response regulator transcription factor [Bacillota bacterium]